MANNAIKKIIAYERIYNANKSSVTAFVMATRYYMGYVISGQRDFLHKANYVALAHANTSDIPMVFLRTHIAYEMGHFDNAEDLIASLKPYRNVMKSQDATLYAHYLYFNCVLAKARGKERAANKRYRLLRDYCRERRPKCGYMLMAAASCVFGAFGDALGYLLLAYKNGDRSPYFYICLARALENVPPQGEQGRLLLPLIRWSLVTGHHINNIIVRNRAAVEDVLRKYSDDAEKLYSIYPLDWILYIICTRRMIGNDLSRVAFAYYKEAEVRQIHFPQLYDFLIRSAHKNSIEDVSRYSVAQYLKMGTAPMDMLPFVYHLVLKKARADGGDEKSKEYLESIKEDIMQCAYHAVESRLYGRYYYSLYRFALQMALAGYVVDKNIINFAEQTLKNLLFSYELSFDDSRVSQVLVQEIHKHGEILYDAKGDKIRLELAVYDEVKITCFDENFRNIIDCNLKMQKLVENVDVKILVYFFNKGLDTPDLLINLCLHYMEAAELSLSAVKVFERAEASTQISRSFKMQTRVALGNFYAKNRDYPRAVQYYKHVDESRVAPRNLEQMLQTYIHAGEIALAKRLIARAGNHIADKNLFSAIKRVSSASTAATAGSKSLAALAYEQLLRGRYDEAMLALVLENHAINLAGWVELARSLAAMGEASMALHAKILEIAIRTRNGASKGVQGIFAKMAELAPADDILHDFAAYLSFEIMMNGLMPEYDAVHAMERQFFACNDELISYALAHVYIKNSVVTGQSAEILQKAIKAATEENIILPIFKDIKDKNLISPYIEKNMPFVYRGKAGRNSTVSFYYRTIGEEGYAEVSMKYLRFGLFLCHIPIFYGEEMEYYFNEEIENISGSITTSPLKIANNRPHLLEKASDLYYIINSALVYEQMFKYDMVEEIVTRKLTDKEPPRAKLI